MTYITTIALCCVTTLFSSTGCRAPKPVAPPPVAPIAEVPIEAPVAPDPSRTPDAFASEVFAEDLLELQLGGLAQSRAHSAEVKEYARRMVVNHTAIEVIMTGIATNESIAIPSALSAEDAATVERLSGLTGVAFDKAYMTLMVERYSRLLALFRWQYDNCSNAAVKTFAVQTMPIVAVHSRVADELNAEVNKEELAAAEAAREAAIAAAEAAKLEAAMAAAQAQADAAAKSQRGSRRSRAPKVVQAPAPAP